ncbi:MAG TPA: tRNA 2-thiouridine(34) synthase MnmA [Longimicrobiales bacterium]|nr:tRNA 2-thiouridine(34) synthase MnmA [Longimicrobiales bacterium]
MSTPSMQPTPRTIVVAMSGGVDSSLAAALLVEQGHRVIGVTMKTFCYGENAGPTKTCCGLEGIMDARRVCDVLDVPHYVFDMEDSFGAAVIDDFVSEYAAGRTPNPCVRCNSNTKIPELLRRARQLGADSIATGHYARRIQRDGAPAIARGHDVKKDQTYFLWALPREVLPFLEFPVGELTKPEVRERARALRLATADKPESQEICFVPTGDYADFLARKLGADHAALQAGELVTADGTVVGTHGGYARYTVGQRRGLGGGKSQPLYVLQVRPDRRQVVVGTDDQLAAETVQVDTLNWLVDRAPRTGDRIRVQIRHGAAPALAVVEEIDEPAMRLKLDSPLRAVTPGQSAAVYDGELLLGGGLIRA